MVIADTLLDVEEELWPDVGHGLRARGSRRDQEEEDQCQGVRWGGLRRGGVVYRCLCWW